ncbi:phospholipase [Bifidobacterium myosotis]|uniref:Phospholipase n=1 Tax=Bifidobacterium myosotis TaxID=1630166 RepID=A0A261FE52_9BIFI|nr:dienelactone hydrolase family protein [Bifidobacterium myosotis]OZG57427.1 phospholipase [Bifidobacterium myosotis]
MRLRFTSDLETSPAGDDRLFVMFHGYGNDEGEMVRIIDAVYACEDGLGPDATPHAAQSSAASPASVVSPGTAPVSAAPLGATPSYLSFRGTYGRPYMGGHYWYPDGCGVEERQRECASVGEAITQLLAAPTFASRRNVLIGFSQGGYLSYRLVKAYPDLFDAAILLSPSFKGEESATLESPTRFFLAYGTEDHTIPLDDQRNARAVLEDAGHLTYRTYPGMGHAICTQEIADIRVFLRGL